MAVYTSQAAVMAAKYAGNGTGRTSLTSSTFDGLNLQRCNLRHSNFNGSTFTGTDLRGADLSDCDLTGCTFTNALMDGSTLMLGVVGITVNPGAGKFDIAQLDTFNQFTS